MTRRALAIVALVACSSARTPGALPTSSHACEPFVDPLRDRQVTTDTDTREAWPAYAKFSGCACVPARDSRECGPFPCSPRGCYVAQCVSDADCKLGMCSHHASGPHGYCVGSDPF